MIPRTVVTRANQSRLAFQVAIDPLARQQSATIMAMLGDIEVQDTILINAAVAPVLTVPARQVAKFGVPLRFQVNGSDVSALPVQLIAAGLPTGAFFDPVGGQFEWAPSSSQAGQYRITFTAVNTTGQSASAPVVIEVDDGMPLVSNTPVCSPGATGSIIGRWLSTDGASLSDPTGQSMDLGGTRVLVNGDAVPVLLASPQLVKFVCPAMNTGTEMSLTVKTADGTSGPVNAKMQAFSPEILLLDGSGANQGAISFPDSADIAAMRNYAVASHPAQPGDDILILGTGFGLAPDVAPSAMQVLVGGVPASVETVQAVANHAGLYTVRVPLPEGVATGDAVAVQIITASADGEKYQSNTVKMAIETADR